MVKQSRIKAIVFICLVLVLAIVCIFIYTIIHKRVKKTNPQSPAETINYTPASPVEKKESEDNKDKIVKEQSQNNQNNTSGQKKSVIPTIVNADTNSVSAFVNTIFEEGGTCTATFTKGSVTKSKSSDGFQNVSYTQCAPIDISGLLTSGTWSLTITYSSTTSVGSSASRQVTIP